MRILVDTSAYSAFMRGHPDARRALQIADQIALSPIVLGELQAGFLKGQHTRKNLRELAEFMASDRVSVPPIDEETGVRYGAIVDSLRRAGTPIPTNDLWIAAGAMQHGLRLLTADEHYRRVPQILLEFLEAK